jgi:hypothetical protein
MICFILNFNTNTNRPTSQRKRINFNEKKRKSEATAIIQNSAAIVQQLSAEGNDVADLLNKLRFKSVALTFCEKVSQNHINFTNHFVCKLSVFEN